MNKRYTEIKKENNQICKELAGEYQRFALAFVQSARKYGVKTIGTEVRIKEVLFELRDQFELGAQFFDIIKDEEEYTNQKLIPIIKSNRNPRNIKVYIYSVLILVFFSLWFGVDCYLKQPVPLAVPTEFTINRLSQNDSKTTVRLSWLPIEAATSGYVIYYIDNTSGTRSSERELDSETTSYTVDIVTGHQYTFYLYAKETKILARSKTIELTFPN